MTNHERDQVLADVAGVRLHECKQPGSPPTWLLVALNEKGNVKGYGLWHPRTDANQMSLVKAGLRRENREYEITYFHDRKIHRASVSQPNDPDNFFWEQHASELEAFAQAVVAACERKGRVRAI